MPILIALSLIVLQALLVFVHLAVYATANAAFGIDGAALRMLFVALAGTFLPASLITHWHKGKIIDWYYTASAYWFGLVNFFFGGAVIFFFAASALYSRNYYVSPALLGGVAFGTFFLLHLYGTWTSGRARVTSFNVALPGLPESSRGKKIIFVSDLHLGNVRGARFAAKVVRKIQAREPEIIFIGGDLYDGVACDVSKIIEPLRLLHAPEGVYFITGNHEYFLRDLAGALAAIRGAGIRILNNEKVEIGGIAFIGVDDKAAHRKEDFKEILGKIGVPEDKPTVLLKHEPSHLDVARDAGIALGLFGHTHRGQIFPLNYLTRQIYKGFDYGFRRLGAMQVMTSSGAGTWGPPLRLGTKSEIVSITLSPLASSDSART